jgi:predicted RNA binding protein YcfA (HicA-like mRNA interferase family)
LREPDLRRLRSVLSVGQPGPLAGLPLSAADAEDRDDAVCSSDLDLSDERLDKGLALGVAAGRDDVGDVIGDLPQGGGWQRGGYCGDLSPAKATVGRMAPLPRITGRELVRALGKLGWQVVAQKGSHAHRKHPDHGSRVTVPLHAGETIGPGLLRSILNQAGVTAEELRRVL